jgi:hypothetical protein
MDPLTPYRGGHSSAGRNKSLHLVNLCHYGDEHIGNTHEKTGRRLLVESIQTLGTESGTL